MARVIAGVMNDRHWKFHPELVGICEQAHDSEADGRMSYRLGTEGTGFVDVWRLVHHAEGSKRLVWSAVIPNMILSGMATDSAFTFASNQTGHTFVGTRAAIGHALQRNTIPEIHGGDLIIWKLNRYAVYKRKLRVATL
jgi:hypothetical protein